MKFTLNWLRDHLETEAPLDEILETLTDLGLEVEGVEDPAAALGAFTIARVIEAGRHPDADRLKLCRVETWPNGPDAPSEEVQVVCGAPNARTGLVGVFAAPGTHIPGTGVDLKPGVIRGVASNGMLCSERELMISDEHDGIIELPETAPLGARYIDYAGLDDPVIEIAVTPNRPDALGVAGIARDLGARGLGAVKTPAIEPVAGAFPCPIDVTIDADALQAAPLFCGRLIRNVANGPSPKWLQTRLRAIGLRPISALVDITNFLTYDRNRPLHVFDADKVKGALRVHWAETGSTITALDDKDYALEPTMLAISDANGPESIAGIMGGAATGCTAETVNVFVESAHWDPVTIAAAGRRLKIVSDARYRFERGADPEFARPGLELATRMILDLCGGEASEVVTAGAAPDSARSYRLDPARTMSLVGLEIAAEEQVRILGALGFEAKKTAEGYDVSVPSWRPDVKGEADLVEEIARVASLTKLEARPMRPAKPGVQGAVLKPMQKRTALARRRLAAAGLNECVTYSFVSGKEAALFGGGDPLLKLENPISSELSDMRPSPLPGLLAAAARNQARNIGDFGLFEVGAEYFGPEPGEQRDVAAAIRVGATAPRHWSGVRRPVDLHDARADAEAVLSAIGAPVARLTAVREEAPNWLHPGRAAALKLGPKNTLAVFGELHPSVLAALDVKGPVVAMAVYLENAPFPKAKGGARPALALSAYQAVERDFAFVVDARTEAETILRAARAADKALIEEASVFDVFDGPKAEAQMGEGRKSVAISVRLQPTKGTLTDEEIEAVAARVVAGVEKATGGALRS
ncbi:phenylalanine--tRNA ligase subunit beta [Pikeienuella piscinae]|uniref:Phenylalanine--tRNA ligase beta subunit n=1 Tax=Pikeienuella piscinae TaxID=2748098 RepID=A0A7L5BY08_9RHOB|nr:phenylalanine--tRNA ligase subunit beta [Pikeienuella piscinae]QIE55728.1 phenylalanine--tRNA ligase subunit beta [Pikeienuella piscinae]